MLKISKTELLQSYNIKDREFLISYSLNLKKKKMLTDNSSGDTFQGWAGVAKG